MIAHTDIIVDVLDDLRYRAQRYHYFGAAQERAQELERSKTHFIMVSYTADDRIVAWTDRMNVPKQN